MSNLRRKALEMRDAINAIELALCGDNNLEEMRRLFEAASDRAIIHVDITAQNLREIGVAFDRLNRIVNSPEFLRANLSG